MALEIVDITSLRDLSSLFYFILNPKFFISSPTLNILINCNMSWHLNPNPLLSKSWSYNLFATLLTYLWETSLSRNLCKALLSIYKKILSLSFKGASEDIPNGFILKYGYEDIPDGFVSKGRLSTFIPWMLSSSMFSWMLSYSITMEFYASSFLNSFECSVLSLFHFASLSLFSCTSLGVLSLLSFLFWYLFDPMTSFLRCPWFKIIAIKK